MENKLNMKKETNFRKKHRIKKKKTLLENNFLSAFFLIIFLIFGGIYLLLFYPFLKVDSFSIIEEGGVKTEEMNKIKEYINNNFIGSDKNILLIPIKEIENKIFDDIPSIDSVSVRRVFPSEIEVIVNKREVAAIWCKDENTIDCYFIDKKGVVFEKTEHQDEDLLIFFKERNFEKGNKILKDDSLIKYFSLKDFFQSKEIGVVGLYFPSENVVELLTQENWRAFFFTDKIEEGLKDLEIVLKKIDNIEREDLEYIDLRFKDRVYLGK